VLHAHCLAAALASVRTGFAVVYDVILPVERALAAKPGSCQLRSLALAETFALRKAHATVVHSRAMWNWALRRGVQAGDLYLIPELVNLPAISEKGGAQSQSRITFYAPGIDDAPSLELILRAFSILAGEIEGADLLVETPPEVHVIVAQRAAALELTGHVRAVAAGEREQVLASVDVVIASGTSSEGPSSAAISAFSSGHALLAADVAANREVTQNGRGCLWYRPDSPRDLAFRAAFLARNPDLRAALGRAGRAHLEASRGARAVAESYDEVYRHAVSRHTQGSRPDLMAKAPVLQVG
jgi:glycosyltransferase involved in cell wall biosynthesis